MLPGYQVHIAAAAAASALVSGAFLLSTGFTPQGKIKLTEDADPDDPFNVTRAEDVVDGEPIDERSFWIKVRLRKMAMTFMLAVILVLQTISLAWFATAGYTANIVAYALHVAFALYVLVLTVHSLPQDSQTAHTTSILHIGILTINIAFLLSITAILPSSQNPVASFVRIPFTLPIWYTSFGLYVFTALVAMTTPLGPPLNFPPSQIYDEKTVSQITNKSSNNVCGIVGASIWETLMFSYTTKVVMLGNQAASLEIGDLPIVPGDMRATAIYASMRNAMRTIQLKRWKPKPGSGFELGYRLARLNVRVVVTQMAMASVTAVLFYAPALFLNNLVKYLENDFGRENRGWGFVYCAGLFFSNAINYFLTGQLWSLSTTTFQVRLKVQLNSILFAKTLVRKDVASSAASTPKDASVSAAAATTGVNGETSTDGNKDEKKDEGEFSSKAQIMTLMTTDVDRVSEFAWHMFSLVDAPIEIVIGAIFLYRLLGVSSFIGLAVTCLFLPLNHFAGKIVVKAQDGLMEARDERVALMNEILGAIRMLKFMAWERSFEKKVLKVRDKELKWQRTNYLIETAFNAIWEASPLVVTLVSFWHFAVFRQQTLSPSIAFTSIAIFQEMKFALNTLPETFVNMLQSLVSLRRIEKYLQSAEVASVAPFVSNPTRSTSQSPVSFASATVTWPQARGGSAAPSGPPSAASTPKRNFMLLDLNVQFPRGELSLICGKLGSGKTLMLLALLGEADLLAGQVTCPRSPPDALAAFAAEKNVKKEDWVVDGICAYVPQAAWLRNASIKDNILFNLPYDEKRYEQTLQACALVNDLEILEDGDESEIGERGVNLSGGQKARVSLARAVYSRASILLLDDVLSAVDAHTAHHLYHECLQGPLMKGRTIVLVSHHVQLCAPGAAYVVTLENGRVAFSGKQEEFLESTVMKGLVQSHTDEKEEEKDAEVIADEKEEEVTQPETSDKKVVNGDAPPGEGAVPKEKKAARKLVEEEKRAVGRVGRDIWLTYLRACGGYIFWIVFGISLLLATVTPIFENGWLRIWSRSSEEDTLSHSPGYYVAIYCVITVAGLVLKTWRWFNLYYGSIHASKILYERLLETVLFAQIRFHDTVSRGRLLNRFGKDFEGIDSSLSDNLGRSIMYSLNVVTTFVTITYIGGWPFLIAALVILSFYFDTARVYSQTSRDMRRLDSVTRSPLYSIYGETIAGVTILRAFGASSKFLRDMLRCVDVNTNPYYWMWGVNRWLSMRFNLLSSAVVGVTGLALVLTPSVDAALAGFALAFASTISGDILFLTRRFVGLEQSMVALERVKEYTDLVREAPEFQEPRPAPSWPEKGDIKVENLVIRYAPELPNVLHKLNFEIKPGEKVGILGRTGSGKSTLALSFFRFVEATEGRILVDDVDISTLGLTDLRSKLTIIPQDPTILSGTVRSTLDVFDEYEDAHIYEALRRVHLIPSEDVAESQEAETVNANVFKDLDSPVSEGGDNFSTGEKQLLCMARAILKRSKVLVMDEATASVDYATDELIGKTIRQEFASSTLLTIAHRLRTVIDYDRVMVLEAGKLVEFDSPGKLLSDSSTKFYSLCKATGKKEFAQLKKMAGV